MIREILERLNEKVVTCAYISLEPRIDSAIKITRWQEENLPEEIINRDLHCTIIYSKKPIDLSTVETSFYEVPATFKAFEKWGDEGQYLVALLESEPLQKRYEELTAKYGFISDFPTYKPYITLSYKAQGIDISILSPFDFTVWLNNETVEELDTEWGENV